jgi:lipopolysaccharide/colanic/teichoic acid biosynthesis glycosyltransferase
MLEGALTLKNYAIAAHAKEELRVIVSGRDVSPENGSSPLFSEELFGKLLCLERKRSERSRKPFALMLVDASKPLHTDRRKIVFAQLAIALSLSTRETDIWGWHKKGSVIGVILTEIGAAEAESLRHTILSKLTSALRTSVNPGELDDIRFSFHMFPEDPSSRNAGPADTKLYLYPDLQPKNDTKKTARLLKRGIDIAGSLTALILLSPLFLAVALAIKLTSKGPILFKQARVGQYGLKFTFLKFRSMYYGNDPKIHQEYLRQFIAGKQECKQANGNGGVYKLTYDPRITPVGTFLRKSSLDELPQFFNVLRGEMSLVGPRPPIPYETEAYDLWHRRRFLEVKPGITGLWQVKGRSKLKFDDMVRLDIKYARDWSLGLDLRILLATPRVVFFGDGAC